MNLRIKKNHVVILFTIFVSSLSNNNICTAASKLLLYSGQAPNVIHDEYVLPKQSNGMAIPTNSKVSTPAGSRARIMLANGDIINLGEKSAVNIDSQSGSINLIQGLITVYALPSVQGNREPLTISTPEGSIELKAGKASVSHIIGGKIEISAFNNLIIWHPRSKSSLQPLAGGSMITVDNGSQETAHLPKEQEQIISQKTSPEAKATAKAIGLYSNNDHNNALILLRDIQKAFPYNGKVAYYLGQIAMERQNIDEAIKQWRKYEKYDPEGAKEDNIPRLLSLLIAEKIKAEINIAMQNEAKLSQSPPVPSSIAVIPFNNKGSEKFKSISMGLAAMLISDLSKVPGLKILERIKIQKILDEIKLSQSGLIDSNSSIRAGRLLKSEKMVMGDYAVADDLVQGK